MMVSSIITKGTRTSGTSDRKNQKNTAQPTCICPCWGQGPWSPWCVPVPAPWPQSAAAGICGGSSVPAVLLSLTLKPRQLFQSLGRCWQIQLSLSFSSIFHLTSAPVFPLGPAALTATYSNQTKRSVTSVPCTVCLKFPSVRVSKYSCMLWAFRSHLKEILLVKKTSVNNYPPPTPTPTPFPTTSHSIMFLLNMHRHAWFYHFAAFLLYNWSWAHL